MSRLEELIAEHCPDGVEYVKLNELLDYEQPTKYIVEKANYNDEGIGVPVLTAGKSFLLGYTEETEGIYEASQDQSVIIFDDFTTSFHWVSKSFKVKSSALKIITPKEDSEKDFLFRYVYYAMRSLNFQRGGHRRYWIREYSNLTIPLPPIEVQNEIVRILDTFTELTQELTQERELREKQYEYYRDKLLTFGDDVPMKKLGDVCEIKTGKLNANQAVAGGEYPFFTTSKDISYIDNYVWDTEALLIAGNANLGDVKYYNGKFNAYQRTYVLSEFDKDVDIRFLYYVCLKNLTEYLSDKKNVAAMSYITISTLRDFQIPIPPIETQNEIVAILDRFNTLANDINHGLPKEIELRQKQYEYYRDKLLTFEEVTS